MYTYNSDNIIPFNGRVYYANKTARDCAPQYREIIHQLKHYTANKELSHYIYLNQYEKDKLFSMNIVTKYEHEKKVGGFDAHTLENIYIGNDFNKAKIYFLNGIKKINSWKKTIDMTNSHECNSTDLTPKKTSIWTKLRKILHI